MYVCVCVCVRECVYVCIRVCVYVWSGEAFDTHALPPIRMECSSRDVFMNERAAGRTDAWCGSGGGGAVRFAGPVRAGEDGARAGSSDG